MTDRRRRRRRPQPASPAARGSGLRHVPRPAGAAAAAASVRGCRGRRSAPPAAFVCILRKGRLLAASPVSRAPASPRRRARAHSVPTVRSPARMRRRGVGRDRASRGHGTPIGVCEACRGGPAHRPRSPSTQLGSGSRAPPAGRTQGGGRAEAGAGVPSTHCCLELCVRIDGGRNKRSDWLVIGFYCAEDS